MKAKMKDVALLLIWVSILGCISCSKNEDDDYIRCSNCNKILTTDYDICKKCKANICPSCIIISPSTGLGPTKTCPKCHYQWNPRRG